MTDWLTFVSFEHFLPLSFIRFMQESPPPQGGGLFRFPKPLPRGEHFGCCRTRCFIESLKGLLQILQQAHFGSSLDYRAAFGGHPHQSRIGSEEPIFDSFSLKGEAFGGNLPPCTAKRAALDTGQGFSPRGEAVSPRLFGTAFAVASVLTVLLAAGTIFIPALKVLRSSPVETTRKAE